MTENNAPANVFEIPGANLAGFEEKIGKLVKRAAKLKVGEITYEILSTRTEPIMRCGGLRGTGLTVCSCLSHLPHDLYDTGAVRTFHTIEVKGDAPCLPGGWRLLAAIEPLTAEVNSVLRVPGDETPLSADFWTCDMRCDHCKTKRARKNSFLVVNDAGDIKLVGRNCIADFLGHEDPKAILSFAQYLFDAVRLGGEAEEMGWGAGSNEPLAYSLVHLLADTSACIRAGGWVSKGRAYETGDRPTAADVITLRNPPLRNAKDMIHWREWARVREATDEDRAEAEAAVEWAAAIDLASANDYLRNLATTARAGFAIDKTVGIACSLLPTFRRERDRNAALARTAESSAGSRFIGEVGKRECFMLTVTKHLTFDGQYGVTHLYLFHDADGNVFKWMASRGQDFDVGRTYTGMATVKKHDDYKGIKQNVITRGKFEPSAFAA